MIVRLRSGVKKFWAGLALLSVEMLVISGLFLLALVAFIYVTRRIFLLRNEELDLQVFAFLSQYVNETNNSIMQFITFFGTHKFLIPANLLLIAYFLLVKKHKWYSIKVPAVAISSLLMMAGLKNLFGRERPLIPLLEQARGLSFPSGHALMSVTFYGLMVYIVWHSIENKTAKWTIITFLLFFIFLIGFSRIYLKVHYTTDVIAGFAIGFLWLVISLKVIRRIEKYSQRNLNPIVHQPAVPAAK